MPRTSRRVTFSTHRSAGIRLKKLGCARDRKPVSSKSHFSSYRSISMPREPSTSKASKASKVKRGIAPPEKYAHLNPLRDHLADNLDVVFCGINPGQKSAQLGHHFCASTNQFWACLHESGLTTEKLRPVEDSTLPERFSIGLTDLVVRPTAEQSELTRAEQRSSVPDLLGKISLYKPRIVCFVGLGITELFRKKAVPKSRRKAGTKDGIVYGLEPYKLVYDTTGTETLFFSVVNTSGRVTQYLKKDKVQQFRELRLFSERIKEGEFDSSEIAVLNLEELS